MDIKILTYHINRGWVPYWRILEEKEKVFLGYSNHNSRQVITDLWIKLETNEDFDTIKLNLIHDKIDILSEPRFYVSIYKDNMPDDYAARGIAPAYNTLDSFLLGNIWNGTEGENTIIKLSTPKEAGTYYINIHSNQAGLYAKEEFEFINSNEDKEESSEPAQFKITRGTGKNGASNQEPLSYPIMWKLNGGTAIQSLPSSLTISEAQEIYNNLNNYVTKEYYIIKNKYFSGPDSWGILHVEVEWELDNNKCVCINFYDDDKEQNAEVNEKYYIPNTKINLPVNWPLGLNRVVHRIEYYQNEDASKYYSPHIKYNSSNLPDKLYCIPFKIIAPWPLFTKDENGEWQTAYNIYIKEGENQWQ